MEVCLVPQCSQSEARGDREVNSRPRDPCMGVDREECPLDPGVPDRFDTDVLTAFINIVHCTSLQ